METKCCTKCGETKPLDEFHRDKRSKDGRVTRCKSCVKAYQAEWRERSEVQAHAAEWYSQNRDAILKRKAEHYQSNPHLWWEYAYRQRARAYGVEPRVVSFTREALVERYGDRCFHCGGPFESLDHWPQIVSRGGEHSLENCRPSCMNCQQLSWREDFTPTANTQLITQ